MPKILARGGCLLIGGAGYFHISLVAQAVPVPSSDKQRQVAVLSGVIMIIIAPGLWPGNRYVLLCLRCVLLCFAMRLLCVCSFFFCCFTFLLAIAVLCSGACIPTAAWPWAPAAMVRVLDDVHLRLFALRWPQKGLTGNTRKYYENLRKLKK